MEHILRKQLTGLELTSINLLDQKDALTASLISKTKTQESALRVCTETLETCTRERQRAQCDAQSAWGEVEVMKGKLGVKEGEVREMEGVIEELRAQLASAAAAATSTADSPSIPSESTLALMQATTRITRLLTHLHDEPGLNFVEMPASPKAAGSRRGGEEEEDGDDSDESSAASEDSDGAPRRESSTLGASIDATADCPHRNMETATSAETSAVLSSTAAIASLETGVTRLLLAHRILVRALAREVERREGMEVQLKEARRVIGVMHQHQSHQHQQHQHQQPQHAILRKMVSFSDEAHLSPLEIANLQYAPLLDRISQMKGLVQGIISSPKDESLKNI